MSSTTASTSTSSRGSLWSDEEVRALIAIWGEANVQEELDGAVRNKVVYQDISKKLQDQGYNREWEQCKTKIKNLKKEYRQLKDHNGETGRGRKTCKFFRELDAILGHRPASVPTALLDTGTSSSTCTVEENTEETQITDGDDVQAESPIDSALIPESEAGPSKKQPGEEAATPLSSKKRRTEKKTRAEKGMERAMDAFLKYQMEADERYAKQDEERWQKEMEFEENRMKQNLEHELRMMELLGRMFHGGNNHSYGRSYEFNDDVYHPNY